MKELTSYNRTVQYLNKVFKLINAEYYNEELEMPTITIQSTVGAYGHVTTSKVWQTESGNASYELNIGADYLSRPIENVVATLIHESVHLYCLQNGIKDTSNRGIYHNKTFKQIAESKGLQIDRHERYGWTVTTPTEETIDFCIRNELTDIKVTRNTGFTFTGIGTDKAGNGNPARPTVTKKKGNSIKWICPCCGNIVRSTKELNIICGDCNIKFERAI